jgi:hypothetical protein
MVARRIRIGATSFTPASLPGLLGWWKADTGVTTSGGNVTAVVNQASPGTYNLSNSGTVPFNATSAYNSLPAFDFVEANDALLTTGNTFAIGTGTVGSVFIVGRMLANTAAFGRAIAYQENGDGNDSGSTTSASWLLRNGSTDAIEAFRNGGALSSSAITLNTNYRLGVIFDGANATSYVNNVAGTPSAYTNAWGSPGEFTVGSNLGLAGWEGPILEIVVTNSALNSTERGNLDSYFTTRLGA